MVSRSSKRRRLRIDPESDMVSTAAVIPPPPASLVMSLGQAKQTFGCGGARGSGTEAIDV